MQQDPAGNAYAPGINGIDYKMDQLKYEWVEAAHQLGMVVNVWTVDSSTEILKYIGWGVDFIDKVFIEK